MKEIIMSFFLTRLFLLVIFNCSNACTSIVVTKEATVDGSVIITYLCDGEFLGKLRIIPSAEHSPDEYIEFKNRKGEVIKVPQVPHTYNVVGLMNEHQLAIGETTFGGRKELRNPDGLFHYWDLMILALQRAKTAREAIKIITSLAEKYGYRSTGETFSIADKNEVWLLEMIGKGPGRKGVVWVAKRVPDGEVSVHANMARIRDFPKNDPENAMYSEDVISFAIEMGYYNPKSGKPFSFADAYDPPDPEKLKHCARRVWRVLSRVAPSLGLSPDFSKGIPGAKPYPFSVKPDKKLSVRDVIALLRDHYEGTPFDMRKGIDAGPFHLPYRWRPLSWKVNGEKYSWERPISTQQTSFSFVSQARSFLPDPIGGVFWYSPDDTFTNCYVPFYCSITEVPEEYQKGDLQHFSTDSAWWIFNFVSNFAYLKYDYMVKDIQKVQKELEDLYFSIQPAIEKTALYLYEKDPKLMRIYLTNYSNDTAKRTFRKWQELAEYLITKYNDGYVKDEKGRPKGVGYPLDWLERVIKENPDKFKVKEEKN